MGLGRSTHVVTLLTLSLEGASPQVPPNQFARKRMKKFKNNPRTSNIEEIKPMKIWHMLKVEDMKHSNLWKDDGIFEWMSFEWMEIMKHKDTKTYTLEKKTISKKRWTKTWIETYTW